MSVTSKERVLRALRFERPDRVPRDIWVLPGARILQPADVDNLFKKFEPDIVTAPIVKPKLPYMRGEWYKQGTYIDEWGCVWTNLRDGIIGEVKQPLVKEWSDLEKLKAPYQLVGKGFEDVDNFCKSTDKFICAPAGTIFERMQFVRGPENLYMDIATQPSEFITLRDIVFDYFIAETEALCKTSVDAICVNDDWGSQKALLINPLAWRKLFKPLYKKFVRLCRDYGKFAFMHSDGFIFDIYKDLIEIGVDAINSQLFCMPIEEIGKNFAGRICFWGEIDRQHLLVHGTEHQVRQAVRRVWENLSHNGGGVIAQFEYGIETSYKCAAAVFDEWEKCI
jgi:uroporphyrinogen decarboxylase